jgi:hypothetical protein
MPSQSNPRYVVSMVRPSPPGLMLVLVLSAAGCDCESWLATHRTGAPPVAQTRVERALETSEGAAARPAPSAPPKNLAPLPKTVVPAAPAAGPSAPPPPPASFESPDEEEEEEEEATAEPAVRRGPAPMPPGMAPLKLPGGFNRPPLIRPPQIQFKLDPKSLHAPPP